MTSSSHLLPFQGQVMSVTGPLQPDYFTVVDAHNHIWIDPVKGSSENSPILTEYDLLLNELKAYFKLGGNALIDCQPGGCGRNGLKLRQLAQASGIAVVAGTGFHRRLYYALDWWLWQADAQKIARYFIDEIQTGLTETLPLPQPVRAGFIKCACEAKVNDTPQMALTVAALAAAETGVCVEIHTERGGDAEAILEFFVRRGVRPQQIVLCHLDKAADFGLHCGLIQAGATLEYDTFYRSKYSPETTTWPLLEKMVEAGYDGNIVLATDMADVAMWKHAEGCAGLTGFITQIGERLEKMGLADLSIQQLLGKNIINRMAGSPDSN